MFCRLDAVIAHRTTGNATPAPGELAAGGAGAPTTTTEAPVVAAEPRERRGAPHRRRCTGRAGER